ncbi:MAG TPA: DUF1538 domain-containing protein, partial [Chromatiales bacterium]|nr:DUF1538 domain-containing protein [Chromatiales bacterium]
MAGDDTGDTGQGIEQIGHRDTRLWLWLLGSDSSRNDRPAGLTGLDRWCKVKRPFQPGCSVKEILLPFLQSLFESLRDLLPILLVITFFQLVVLRQPMPNLAELLYGTFLVVLGLTLFVQGLRMGLFPLGESMAYAFARKGSLLWLLAFAFALGFGTTVAEPALIAVAEEASEVAAGYGAIANSPQAMKAYADGLRYTGKTDDALKEYKMVLKKYRL